jgi:triosephosphate isomerase
MSIIIANWKMNKGLADSVELVTELSNKIIANPVNCEVVVCPSFPYLITVKNIIKDSSIALGAQDCSFANSGAYTGDVSPSMLVDSGCDYVILGHSERRGYHNETSAIIKQKAEIAHQQNLTTIICVGESLQDWEKNLTFAIIKEQVLNSLPLSINENNTIIAYEPVWAIGSGKSPTIEEIEKTHNYIIELVKDFVKLNGILFEKNVRVVYGGSVKVNNCRPILNIAAVDGLLVGGASLIVEEFYNILTQV